jgi:hypothetical protein
MPSAGFGLATGEPAETGTFGIGESGFPALSAGRVIELDRKRAWIDRLHQSDSRPGNTTADGWNTRLRMRGSIRNRGNHEAGSCPALPTRMRAFR